MYIYIAEFRIYPNLYIYYCMLSVYLIFCEKFNLNWKVEINIIQINIRNKKTYHPDMSGKSVKEEAD